MNSTLAKRPLRTKLHAAVVISALALGGSTAPALATNPDQAPPLAPSQTRVWFLRQLLPGTAFHSPMVYVNGTPIAISGEGTAFYRDFAPGQYTFSVENCLPQPGTSRTLALRPDTEVALLVTSDENGAWDCVPPQISYLQQLQPQEVPNAFAPLTYLGAK
jgi:hypothetical protein